MKRRGFKVGGAAAAAAAAVEEKVGTRQKREQSRAEQRREQQLAKSGKLWALGRRRSGWSNRVGGEVNRG